ncbi:DHA1 family 2-module integral membrane pump EmrD-like MFS transporter [Oceanisphaera litoralis]|uniref:MFS transporter n=1 Tax=Oceanisphaera litoralis TaxID=225144 RepID=UPI0019587B6A|nr:MFS transporter [Oceanisphaera litoralis]MBM7454561.1 DHA1 family 2-module integral membrane pump EmrD-like MFS transporter [Oceanisphaera litoralis]
MSGLSLVLLTVLMVASGQMTQTLYVPAMGDMAAALQVAGDSLPLVMAFYLIPYGLFQFIYGPLSDRFGRRPVLLVGLTVYVLGSALILIWPVFPMLLLGSFIQGAGTAAAGSLCRSLMRDKFEGSDLVRYNGYVSMGIMLAPLLAPLIGGYLNLHFGWQSMYQFLLVVGLLITLVMVFCFRETLPAERRHAQPMLPAYQHVLHNSAFCRQLGMLVAAFAGVILYEAVFGVLVSQQSGLTSTEIGLLFILPLPLYFAGAMLASVKAASWSILRLQWISTVALLLGASIVLASAFKPDLDVAGLVLGGGVYFAGAGLLFPVATSRAVAPFPQHSGTAGALLGGSSNLGGGLFLLVQGALPQMNQSVLGGLLLAFAGLVAWLLMPRTDALPEPGV